MKANHFFAGLLIPAVLFVAGCGNNTGQRNQSTVSVIGTGTVLAQPDTITMMVSLSKTSQTTKLAQDEVSAMVRRTLQILKNAGIEDKNISTASLTFNSEYDYASGGRILLGQRAEQTISFSINELQTNGEKVSQIIDELIQINGIELNQIDFNIKDNTEYFTRSRELAFQKAVQKAEQYAALSGLTVAKVLSIAEEGSQDHTPIQNRMLNRAEFEAAALTDAASSVLPAGELEIRTTIQAVFLLE